MVLLSLLLALASLIIADNAQGVHAESNVCTFDNGDTCGWTLVSSGQRPYTWQVLSCRDRDPHVPAFDHSTLESFGKFVYFNASIAPSSGTKLTKAFTRQHPNEPTCLRLWMYIQGRNPGEVHVTVDGHNSPVTEIAVYSGSEGAQRWNQYTVAIPESLTQYVVGIEGRRSLHSGNGGIAVDEIALSPTVCKQVDCTFEYGMCSWEKYYDSQGNMDYNFIYGNSSILPSEDDSVDRGVFIFVPIRLSSSPATTLLRHDGLVQRNAEQGVCVHFDYLVTAEYVGRLTLWHYWLEKNNEYSYAIVWSSREEPNYGSWQRGQIYLDGTLPWTLMFEVITDGPNDDFVSSRLHGIAIDNIEHELVDSAGLCPKRFRPNPSTIATRGTTTVTTIDTTTSTPATGNTILQSCNFDQDTCSWTVVSGSNITWHRSHPDYGDDNAWTVPYRLDSSENDWLLFAETTAKPSRQTMGSIAAPMVPAPSTIADYCLRFWIYFEADMNSEINIIREDSPARRETLLGRYTSKAQPEWTAEQTHFTVQSAFQIIFRAITHRGAGLFGAVAVDEYVLEAGKCSDDSSTVTATPTTTAAPPTTAVPIPPCRNPGGWSHPPTAVTNEQVTNCGGCIAVPANGSATLNCPVITSSTPAINYVQCQYVVSGPAGMNLKFIPDPENFKFPGNAATPAEYCKNNNIFIDGTTYCNQRPLPVTTVDGSTTVNDAVSIGSPARLRLMTCSQFSIFQL